METRWKRYRAIGCTSLYIDVVVNKKRTERIHFTNGGVSTKNGIFTTSDPELQAALEKSPDYGVFYKLYEEGVIKPNPIAGPGQGAPGAYEVGDGQKEYLDTDKKEEPAQEDDVLKFPNYNALRDFLIKEKGQSMANVRTLALATAAMEKLGLKFVIE